MTSLLLSSAAVSVLHGLLPAHWLPLMVLGRARKWPTHKTLSLLAVGASAHSGFTILLGGGAALLGGALARITELSGYILPGTLFVFGLLYLVLGATRGHRHGSAEGAQALALLVGLALTPCEAMLPLFFVAGGQGVLAFGAVSLIMLATTVGGTVTIASLLAHTGETRLLTLLERHERAVVGALFISLALGSLLVELVL